MRITKWYLYSKLLAEFLLLFYLLGSITASFIYAIAIKQGLNEILATLLAILIPLCGFGYYIYQKWAYEKLIPPQILTGKELSFRVGVILLALGNLIALLLILGFAFVALFHVEPVVGGVMVLGGGLICIVIWAGGWAWTKSALITMQK